MSGGGGNYSSFSGSSNIDGLLGGGTSEGGISDNEPDCEAINIKTFLASPKSTSHSLQIGDKLRVDIFDSNGTKALGVYDNSDHLIGGLNSQSEIIMNCIENGYEYIATVIDKTLAMIQVQITISN